MFVVFFLLKSSDIQWKDPIILCLCRISSFYHTVSIYFMNINDVPSFSMFVLSNVSFHLLYPSYLTLFFIDSVLILFFVFLFSAVTKKNILDFCFKCMTKIRPLLYIFRIPNVSEFVQTNVSEKCYLKLILFCKI